MNQGNRFWSFFTGLIFFIGTVSPLLAQVDMDRIEQDVYILSDDKMMGRETGTIGEKRAARYIAYRFEEIGLKSPEGQDNYYHKFEAKTMANPHREESSRKTIRGRNVLGFYDAGVERTIVVGAHYDHLGMGGSGSLDTGDPEVHNGADDNASGVAALFGLAEMTVDNELPANILFIAFSGEENGLLGSKSYTRNPALPLDRVDAMFNMDMIGRLDEDRGLALYGVGTSPYWGETLPTCIPSDLPIKKTKSGVGPSDHTSFYLEDIPVLHFFTGQHEDYHKPTDDPDKLNYKGLEEVIDIVYCFLEKTARQDDIAFIETKNERSNSTPGFSVTLGVMPDYLFDGEGMRIDAVQGDGPASAAGLQDGDVVVQLGDIDVTGMQSYMKALSKFEEGDKTTVVVRREGEEHTYDIQF